MGNGSRLKDKSPKVTGQREGGEEQKGKPGKGIQADLMLAPGYKHMKVEKTENEKRVFLTLPLKLNSIAASFLVESSKDGMLCYFR